MVYSLAYRRPPHVRDTWGSLDGEEKQKSINESINSGSSCMSSGIPDALSFDRILSGGTCPPCTVRDFMNYLNYIEHSAENLQFHLWFKDYSARFQQLPASQQALSPYWTLDQTDAEPTNGHSKHKTIPRVSAILENTDFADSQPTISAAESPAERNGPFDTPPKSPSVGPTSNPGTSSDYGSTVGSGRPTFESSLAPTSIVAKQVAEQAFEDAGMKWKPFTTQPYREEINRIISIYIAEDSPRELNLSGRERRAVLHALQNTTHPSALRSVAITVEYSLRRQAHPNFVRWTICNGNRPRVVFARGLGIAGILAGFTADLLITLSSVSRAWRVLPFLGWFIGIATLVAAWKGMCVVLHGLHHRHLRPWELFGDETEDVIDEKGHSTTSLVSDHSNSYEDLPWVARYSRRNFIRKIFDREVWVQEPALRQIQDTIFLQAILGSFVLSCIFVGIFCAVPKGNFY